MSMSIDPQRCSPPLLVVMSGPSGVGKDAVLKEMRLAGAPYYFAVTATTRPMRDAEVDGVDYIFVRDEDFRRMIRGGDLLEWAEVYGNLYGVPKDQIRDALRRGDDVILKIDIQGADNVRRQTRGAVYVFLTPPGIAELEHRLKRRKTESLETLRVRLATAAKEMEEAGKFDYLVVNRTDLAKEAAAEIMAIISRERARPGRTEIVI